MVTLSSLLELLGLMALVLAAYLVDWRLAIAGGGVVLVLVGMALDPQPRGDRR